MDGSILRVAEALKSKVSSELYCVVTSSIGSFQANLDNTDMRLTVSVDWARHRTVLQCPQVFTTTIPSGQYFNNTYPYGSFTSYSLTVQDRLSQSMSLRMCQIAQSLAIKPTLYAGTAMETDPSMKSAVIIRDTAPQVVQPKLLAHLWTFTDTWGGMIANASMVDTATHDLGDLEHILRVFGY
ncbi:hypothetical protein PV08_11354 [Exophiala spinifera]|uniref:Uncharacterized protein n=1 Tax=Exophiala spinifera TaxID=91928 RepID=A0A0D1ZBK3_9EURO|nr:uncharacterized protein PV08_11354 [Exophiala spinifera]KIW10392.1 hypothetical protein PV08_11354 [Exophiala spinifera]